MMRVRHLQTYLSGGGLLQESDLKMLRCMRVGIETAYWLRLLSPLRDPLGEPLGGVSASSLICALTEQLDFFRLHDICPTFVFDGVVPVPQHALFSSHRQQHIEEAWLLYARNQLALLRNQQQQQQQRKKKTSPPLSYQGDEPRCQNTPEAVSSADTQTAAAAAEGTSSSCSSRGHHPVSTAGRLSTSEQRRAAQRRRDEALGESKEVTRETHSSPSSCNSSNTEAEEAERTTTRRRMSRAEQDARTKIEEQSRTEVREDVETDQAETRATKQRATEDGPAEETQAQTSYHEDEAGKEKQSEDEHKTNEEKQLQTTEEYNQSENKKMFVTCSAGRPSTHTFERSHEVAHHSTPSSALSSSCCYLFSSSRRVAQRKREGSTGSRDGAWQSERGSSSGSGSSTSSRRMSTASEGCSEEAEVVPDSCSGRFSASDHSSERIQQASSRSYRDSNSSSRRSRSSGSSSSSSKQTQGTGESPLCCDRSCSSTPGSGTAHSSASSSSASAGLSTSSSSRNCSSSSSRSNGVSNEFLVHPSSSLSHDSNSSSLPSMAPVLGSSNTTSCLPPSPLLQRVPVSLSSSSSPASYIPSPFPSSVSCLCPSCTACEYPPSSPSSCVSSSSCSPSSCCCCSLCSSRAPPCVCLPSPSDVTCKFLQGSSLVTREMLLFTFHFLKSRGIACVCAPSLAAAQLVYWGKHGLFEAVLGPPALVLFGATRVLLHIDWMSGSFRWLEQQQLLQLCGVSSPQFLDACLLAGTEYCKTFPFLNLPAFHLPYSTQFSFRSAIECAKQAPLLTYILQCPAEAMRKELYEGYCFCKTLVQYPLVLQLDAGVQPLVPRCQVQQEHSDQRQQQALLEQQHNQQQHKPQQHNQQQHNQHQHSQQQHSQQQQVNHAPGKRQQRRHGASSELETVLHPGYPPVVLEEEHLPRDFWRTLGRRLPFHFYFLMMEGILSQDLLSALAFTQWSDSRPPCADSIEYRDILTAVRAHRCTALNMLTAYLHPEFQLRPIHFLPYQPCRALAAEEAYLLQRQQQQEEQLYGRSRNRSSRRECTGSSRSSSSNDSRSGGVIRSSKTSKSGVQAYMLTPEGAPNTRRRWYVDALSVQQEMQRQRTHRVDLLFCLRWHAHAFRHKHMHRLCENYFPTTAAAAPATTARPADDDTCGAVNNGGGAAASHARRQQDERQQEEWRQRLQDQQQPQSCNSVLAAAHFVLLDALGFFSDRLEPTVFGEALMQAPPQFQEEILFFLELLKTGLVDGAAYEPPVDRVYAPEVSALLLLRSQILDRGPLLHPEGRNSRSKQQEQRQQQQQQQDDHSNEKEQQRQQQQQDTGEVVGHRETVQQNEEEGPRQQQEEAQPESEEEMMGSRQQRVLLLSRLCSLLPMQLQPHTCWSGGGISFEVSAFSCVAGVLKSALRHITEASVASVLLRDMQQLHLLPDNLFSPVNALLPTFLLPPNCMGIVMQFLLEYDFLKGKEEHEEEDKQEQWQETQQHQKAVGGSIRDEQLYLRDLTEKRYTEKEIGRENRRYSAVPGKFEKAKHSIKNQNSKAEGQGGDSEEAAVAVQNDKSVLQQQQQEQQQEREQQKQQYCKEDGPRSREKSTSSSSSCNGRRQTPQQGGQNHRSGRRESSSHKSDEEDKATAAATARLKSFEEVLQQHFPCCVDPVGDLCLAVQFWTEVCAAVDRVDDFVDAGFLVRKIDAATDLLILQCTRAGLHAHPRFPIHAFDVLLR